MSWLVFIKDGLAKIEDVIKLLNEKEEDGGGLSSEVISSDSVDLSFDNVSFVYPGKEEYTLRNVDFSLPNGKTLALVGVNGAGKSTITRLLYRFYDVSDGMISIQGKNIKDIKLLDLRRMIGVVSQETFLLNDTIYANLTFGLEDKVSSRDFKKVVQSTNIEDWVNDLPDKYMTIVGERGVKLSGGERKRIGIARVLLKKPKILILDEAVNSLDVDTEHRIFKHINESYKNITKIIITHNEKSLLDVDLVAYLSEGRIAGFDTHHNLLINNKCYREMWSGKKY